MAVATGWADNFYTPTTFSMGYASVDRYIFSSTYQMYLGLVGAVPNTAVLPVSSVSWDYLWAPAAGCVGEPIIASIQMNGNTLVRNTSYPYNSTYDGIFQINLDNVGYQDLKGMLSIQVTVDGIPQVRNNILFGPVGYYSAIAWDTISGESILPGAPAFWERHNHTVEDGLAATLVPGTAIVARLIDPLEGAPQAGGAHPFNPDNFDNLNVWIVVDMPVAWTGATLIHEWRPDALNTYSGPFVSDIYFGGSEFLVGAQEFYFSVYARTGACGTLIFRGHVNGHEIDTENEAFIRINATASGSTPYTATFGYAARNSNYPAF